MSNSGIFSISAPSNPGHAMYEQIARFLQTGSVNPTFSSAPVFRASSAAAAHPATAATGAITLSSSIVAGDFILATVIVAANYTLTPPAGWSLYSRTFGSPSLAVFYKIAVAGDIGATVTFTCGNSTSWSISTCSYSGVWAACPFNSGAQGFSFSSAVAATSTTAPAVTTTVPNTLVIQCTGVLNNGSGLVVPATNRVSDTGGSSATCISEQSQVAAGTTTAKTISWTASNFCATVQMALQGVPTTVSAPPGSWSMIDGSVAQGNATNVVSYVWQTSSNNAGVTWYLVFQVTNPGFGGGTSNQAILYFSCETYSTSTRIWNAPTTSCANSATGNTNTSGSSPPWAQVWGSTLTVGNTYGGQLSGAAYTGVTVAVGTTNLFIAANLDGFFVTAYTTGVIGSYYAGAFTSLITNPAFTDGGIISVCFQTNPAGSCGGTTRDPGVTTLQYWGYYSITNYWPGNLPFQGTINGSVAQNDLFQAPSSTPIAARWCIAKTGYASNPSGTGMLRGLLPAWLQSIPQASCVWGDTVTEGSDTLTYFTGYNGNFWVDTSVA